MAASTDCLEQFFESGAETSGGSAPEERQLSPSSGASRASMSGRSRHKRQPRTKTFSWSGLTLVRAARWGAVVVGVGGGWLVVFGSTTRSSGLLREKAVSAAPESVRGFAVEFVSTFFSSAGAGREDVLRPFSLAPVDLEGMPAGSWFVSRATAAGDRQLGPEYWEVTVAVDLLARGADGSFQPVDPRWYAVGVAQGSDGLSIAGPPALVPAPRTAKPPVWAADAGAVKR